MVPSFGVVAQGMGLSLTIGPSLYPTVISFFIPPSSTPRWTTQYDFFLLSRLLAFHLTSPSFTSLHFTHSPLTLAHIVRLVCVNKIEIKRGRHPVHSAVHGWMKGTRTPTSSPLFVWSVFAAFPKLHSMGSPPIEPSYFFYPQQQSNNTKKCVHALFSNNKTSSRQSHSWSMLVLFFHSFFLSYLRLPKHSRCN